MNRMILRLWQAWRQLAAHEHGQDLVEYALVVALIAFGAVASMRSLASAIGVAFTNLAARLSSTIT